MFSNLKVFIKDRFFNKSLKNIINKNRDEYNWDNIDKPYSLSEDNETLVIVNNKEKFQTIVIYKWKLFNFVKIESMLLDKHKDYRLFAIKFIDISKDGEYIAIATDSHGLIGSVYLFRFVNNKWSHKKTISKCFQKNKDYTVAISYIKGLEFGKDINNNEDILRIYVKNGVVIVRDYYKSNKNDVIAELHN